MRSLRIHIQSSHAYRSICGKGMYPNAEFITVDEITVETRPKICKKCLSLYRIAAAPEPCHHENCTVVMDTTRTMEIKDGRFVRVADPKQGSAIILCSDCKFHRIYPSQMIPKYLQKYLDQLLIKVT